MKQLEDLKWEEIKRDKVKAFQLGDEPEVLYLIKLRDNEYMLVFEDGYDMNTGKVEFANTQKLKNDYGINPT